jgi:hypothetical protein
MPHIYSTRPHRLLTRGASNPQSFAPNVGMAAGHTRSLGPADVDMLIPITEGGVTYCRRHGTGTAPPLTFLGSTVWQKPFALVAAGRASTLQAWHIETEAGFQACTLVCLRRTADTKVGVMARATIPSRVLDVLRCGSYPLRDAGSAF